LLIHIQSSAAKTKSCSKERYAIIVVLVWNCPPEQRKEVEELRKELSKLGTDFDTNIVKSNAPVMFSKPISMGSRKASSPRRASKPATMFTP